MRGQRPDKGKVTIALRVVETVADHELVGHVEPGVGDVDVRAPGDRRGLGPSVGTKLTRFPADQLYVAGTRLFTGADLPGGDGA